MPILRLYMYMYMYMHSSSLLQKLQEQISNVVEVIDSGKIGSEEGIAAGVSVDNTLLYCLPVCHTHLAKAMPSHNRYYS